jgi:hypothetical protein
MASVVDGSAILDARMNYLVKIDAFKTAIQQQEHSCVTAGNEVRIEAGRKFDKIYFLTPDGQKVGRYMVDRNSWDIYGVKSWGQVNLRRWFGTLNTIDHYDWNIGRPHAGTIAESAHVAREAKLIAAFKRRGRPRKTL